jgi:superfamily I DNA/RNA helicase
MNELNQNQLAAATSTADRLLVIAGPGSGKTRTLVARIRHMIESGIEPLEISAITFTNAAGREIERRVAEERPKRYHNVRLGYVGTLHGFCLRLLTEFGEMVGLPSDIVVIDEEHAAQVLDKVVSDLGWKGSRKKLEEAIARGPVERQGRLDKVEVVVAGFYGQLIAEGMLTFDAILHMACKLAGKLNESHMCLGHILVDEVQDCAPIDFEIIERLEFDSRTFVGDPDQSIYSFRGGSVAGINRLAAELTIERIDLEHNYRSIPEVCELAQRVIEHNRDRVNKATRSALGMQRQLAEAIGTFRATYPDDELREIARRIKDEQLQDWAVLCRTNALAQDAEAVLEACGVEVHKPERERLPEDWKKARAIVAFLANPHNDALAMRFLVETAGSKAAQSAKKSASATFRTINEDTGLADDQNALEGVSGYLARYGVSMESIEEIERRIADLPHLATIAELSLAMTHNAAAANAEPQRGGIVTTIHAAKGREFDAVFMPALEDHIFPGNRKDVNIEEERRLFFVGLTRARNRLVLSASRNRKRPFSWRGPEPSDESRFLIEAEEALQARGN